jgi:alpha-tubulin suppressor-like RCC1 family protein
VATLPASAGSTSFVSIAAGRDFGLALRSDGTVLSWGNNQLGQLGLGTTSGYILKPAMIPGLSNVVAISAGAWSSMALKSDGTVVGWGYNQDGEVATGSFTTSVPTPTPINGLSGIKAVSAGGGDMGALKSDGTVWEWGDNTMGQLGTGVTATNYCCVAVPTEVPNLSGVTAIALGGDHTIAVRADGSVWTWGRDAEGELGHGSIPMSGCFCNPTPAPVAGMGRAVAAAAAVSSSLVVKADGSVWTWGGSLFGQLGTGSSINTPTPAQVTAVSNIKGASAYCCGFTYLALQTDGSVVGWGAGAYGELLNNAQTYIAPSPIPASGLPPRSTTALAVGQHFSLALLSDGTLWSAGQNDVGQLGQGFASADVPTAAASLVQTLNTPTAVVDVALGDSYSAGEGAPPFENGSNYPAAAVQENTYLPPAGNGCHRSLNNYAKLAAPSLDPTRSTLLVDRTCSGAQIVSPSDFAKGPIVPQPGRTDSQVEQAINRLQADFGGLPPDKVDVVSVTMGGNDAGFGDIIMACLAPDLVHEFMNAYPGFPTEAQVLIDTFFTCKSLDDNYFHTEQKIAALPGLESQAQAALVGAFPNARILQLTYPDPVPASFPGDSCGGIMAKDAPFARSRAAAIDGAIRTAGASTTAANSHFQVVDLEAAFGSNPLCPTKPGNPLVNALPKSVVSKVIGLLLAPGSQSRKLIDTVVNTYKVWRNCALLSGPGVCSRELGAFDQATVNLAKFFTPAEIQFLLLKAFPDPDAMVLLFHPNPAGWRVMACHFLASYQGTDPRLCPANGGVMTYQVNGVNLTSTSPLPVSPGASVPILFNGFDPGSLVNVSLWSNPIDLGNLTADDSGTVSGRVIIPSTINAGVHMLQFQGTNNSSPRTIRVLVSVAGRAPGGDDLGLYFSGFGADSAVQISFAGLNWGTFTPDASGGIFIVLPFPVPSVPTSFDVVATGLTTGKSVTQTIFPAPLKAAVWATGGDADALSVIGSGIRINGWAHSDGGVVVNGPGTRLTGGLEYGTTIQVASRGVSVVPAPTQVPAGGGPLSVRVADWRPGGTLATQLGSAYMAIGLSACTDGIWHPAPGALRGGLVYVPCNVELDVSGPISAAIVAEGSISVLGSGVHLTSTALGFSLAAGSAEPLALDVMGSGFQSAGALWTAGGANLSGEGTKLACGIYANSISVSGGGAEIAACS